MVEPFKFVVVTSVLGSDPDVAVEAVKYAKVAPTTATNNVAIAITVNNI